MDDMITTAHDFSLLSEDDLYLFNEGRHFRLYDKLGAHAIRHNGGTGVYFAVWAPNAREVSVMGDFTGWRTDAAPLSPRGQSGIWEGFVAGVQKGALYKYHVVSHVKNLRVDKTDPMGFFFEISPKTATITWDLAYEWHDGDWMEARKHFDAAHQPVNIYEMHMGSWIRVTEEELPARMPTYREIAPTLVNYLKKMNFTHVEFLPVMEHPFYGSWGYQTLGYFAPTSRYGSPQDFMFLVDYLHQNGLGVILDWVPSHFPTDAHGLGLFDGTHLYEHDDPRKGFHPDWQSYIFNYGRNEVRSFLISSALFWMDKYHIDGLRVDAVASMLYLDYSRSDGQWIPNIHGGRENLEAIDFLRHLNTAVAENYPGVLTIAEESTSWPMVSRPVYVGGLGFSMKWDMGWMHDTLEYMSKDPIYRSYHHNKLNFRLMYAFSEAFMLPLSHDEVVHGKGSLINKMPGDEWQKFANLRLLLACMASQPGKKLLFMGGEIGQWAEWHHDESLHWQLLDTPFHKELQRWVEDVNRFYLSEPAMHEYDFDPRGFEWIDCNDNVQNTLSLIRKGTRTADDILAVFNFTPQPRYNYRVGAPAAGFWREMLNSDAKEYGGSGQGSMGGVSANPVPFHGLPYSLNLILPPLAAVFFKRDRPHDR